MASINKVILVGNLGADPENRVFPSGDAVCNLRLATSESWKDKTTGERHEATEWHRVVLYRKLAEIAGQSHYCPVDFITESIACPCPVCIRSARRSQLIDPA